MSDVIRIDPFLRYELAGERAAQIELIDLREKMEDLWERLARKDDKGQPAEKYLDLVADLARWLTEKTGADWSRTEAMAAWDGFTKNWAKKKESWAGKDEPTPTSAGSTAFPVSPETD